MVASQSHWSRLDGSNSAENPELSEGGFMLCLRFVQHKQDVAALLHLCHQILSFRPHRCSEATDSVELSCVFYSYSWRHSPSTCLEQRDH